MATLFDCFAPVFARGLQVQDEAPSGPAAAGLRQELLDLLGGARRRAEELRKPAQEVDRAAFAVVAWLDEVVADFLVKQPGSIPGWTPLQAELFRTNNAGNEFFQHLRALGSEQSEVREVYYTALCLGFAGEYSFEPDTLERIKRESAERLPVPPRSPRELAERPLTSQPYEAPLPAGRPRLPRHWERPVLIAASALALLVPLGLIVWFAVPTEAPPPPAPTPAPAPEPPPLDLRAEVERIARSFECADLDFSLGPDSSVLLTGFVASEPDRAALQERVAALDGAGSVTATGVEVNPYPFCEVLLITAPLRERNQQDGIGLDLRAQGGDVLYDGDPLVVDLTTPEYPAFLYLDYVQQDGWIGHVAHAPADEPPDEPNDRFPYDTGYEIHAPFGREMMVLIASPEPLFEQPRPEEFERAEDYLPALRQRIDQLRQRQADLPLAASHVFIRTQPADARP